MALHGTIDEFNVEAVLRLLELAGSVGVLHVESADRRAEVWLRKGACMWAETELPRGGLEPAEALTDAVFELTQLRSGVFRFNSCSPAELEPPSAAPRKLRDLLRDVADRCAEWTRTMSELPSLDHVVELAPKDTEGDLVIHPDQWRLLAKINGGRSVRSLLSSGDGLWKAGTVLASLLAAGLVQASERGAEPPEHRRIPHSDLDDEISSLGVQEAEPEPDIVVVTADGSEVVDDEPEDDDVLLRLLSGER